MYYRHLREVTQYGAWEPWTLYMLNAVEQTAVSTVTKIGASRTAQSEIRAAARAASPGGRNADFLAVMFEQPYCRIRTVVERCGVSRPTATGWLNQLVEADILSSYRVGRDRLFLNHRFLGVLVRDEMVNERATTEPTLFG